MKKTARYNIISFRVNDTELELLQKQAISDGKNLNKFIQAVVLNQLETA